MLGIGYLLQIKSCSISLQLDPFSNVFVFLKCCFVGFPCLLMMHRMTVKEKVLDLIHPWEVNSPSLSSFHIALVIVYSMFVCPRRSYSSWGARNACASFIMVSPVSSIS